MTSYLKLKLRVTQLEKEVVKLRHRMSNYKTKSKRLAKVIRALEQSLISKE